MNSRDQQSGVTHLRTCPACGQVLSLEAEHAGQTACCPACGGAVPPRPEEPAVTGGSRFRSERFDTAAGWAVSSLTQAIVLAALAQITWMIGSGAGRQPAEVGIVGDSDASSIESGSAELDPIDTSMGEIPPLQTDPPSTVEPIQDATGLAMPTDGAAVDPIVGVNLVSGAGEGA